jgi:hypothetical protein
VVPNVAPHDTMLNFVVFSCKRETIEPLLWLLFWTSCLQASQSTIHMVLPPWSVPPFFLLSPPALTETTLYRGMCLTGRWSYKLGLSCLLFRTIDNAVWDC